MIGNGSAYFARVFAEDLGIDFPIFTDPERKTYKALGMRRDILASFSLDIVRNSRRAMSKGFRQTSTQGDVLQLGGVLVVSPDGKVPYFYASRVAGDHPDPAEILAALPA